MLQINWPVLDIIQSEVTVGRVPEKADLVIPVATGIMKFHIINFWTMFTHKNIKNYYRHHFFWQ